MDIQVFHLFEDDALFPLNCICTLIKDQLSVHTQVNSGLDSIPLIYLYANTLVWISLEVG